MLAGLERALARCGVRVRLVHASDPLLEGGRFGVCIPDDDLIAVRVGLELAPEDTLAIAIHEAGHLLLHREVGWHDEETAVVAGDMAAFLLGYLFPGDGATWGCAKRLYGRPAVRTAHKLARWCLRG